MKKIINISESDLKKIVLKVLNEDSTFEGPEMPETPPEGYDELIADIKSGKDQEDDNSQQLTEYRSRYGQKKIY